MLSKRVFLLFFLLATFPLLLILFFHINFILDTWANDQKYKVVITNKSDSPIYFRGSPSLFSCGIFNNEKIYYVTLPPHHDLDIFNINKGHRTNFDINSIIEKDETKIFSVRGDVNNRNFNYEREKELGIMTNQNKEFCYDVHFLFYFTKYPHILNTYQEYVDVMKNTGYGITGHFEKDRVYFTITDMELQASGNTIDNPLGFVYEINYAKVSKY